MRTIPPTGGVPGNADVVWERSREALQETRERAALARQYHSDAFPPAETLLSYPGHHAVAPGQSPTYGVEAAHAEVRPYRARLGRRSRRFARSLAALRRAVTLFVPAWNRRHLHKRAFPALPATSATSYVSSSSHSRIGAG